VRASRRPARVTSREEDDGGASNDKKPTVEAALRQQDLPETEDRAIRVCGHRRLAADWRVGAWS
jgi:hypothetical protein